MKAIEPISVDHSHNIPLPSDEAQKNKIFSIIAHDLRSPFQGLLGYTELLAEENEQFSRGEICEIAQKLHITAMGLFQLLENLLDWTQLQNGKSQVEPELCSLREAVRRSIALHAAQADGKDVRLINIVPENTYVFADEKMLHTILRNLISNAIKFSHKRGIVIISTLPRNDQKIEILISDSGIGMPDAMKNSLFSGDTVHTRRGTKGESSTGLGLLLCKEYVEKNRGIIWVESEENTGTIFHFTLVTP